MKASLDDRIARAADLATTHPAARELLNFYVELARLQKTVYEELRSQDETDIGVLRSYFPALMDLVQRTGPEPLASFGAEHLQSPEVQQELLLACWEDPAGNDLASTEAARFYARVLLQPYAEHLASRGTINLEHSEATCPFCSARPVAGVLRGEGDGAKRWLLCSLCATEWAFRRVLCPHCGEEDKERLPVYVASEFDHVRVEACDRCKTYIKSVDLTRDGHAVPVVDELATVALNIWAENHGYTKLESNLLGL
ncbi:MAG TPA: formate dehydrogenase accessory protein FdhE [Bryobacteraceae bacterium]|nr:formate dehydrogenase accessory protein FdhE [Bryobacteraceae bacterium]